MASLYHVVLFFSRRFENFLHFLQINGAYLVSGFRIESLILSTEVVSVKTFRAILSLLLAVILLLLQSVPLSIHADAPPDPADVLLEGLLACREIIDLTCCALPVADLAQTYAGLIHTHPELFHVGLRLSYTSLSAPSDEGCQRMVAEVYPTYILTDRALTAARTLYRDTLSVMLAEMDRAFGDRTATEAELVLFIHDLLAHRFAYDTRTENPNADAYSFFRDGVGICQALARGAGLEADFVASAAMDHAWNHVRVDGVWYHVDVTRDDPIPACEGSEQVNHTRLLRSDEGMAALGYYGYTCALGHICTDSRFEPGGEAALAEFHAPMIPFGTAWIGVGEGGAPVAAKIGKEEISTGKEGDMDGDGEVTPADLLAVYDVAYPEAWRGWLRGRLVE